MRVGIFYHQEFSINGYYILKDRVKPGFDALQDLITSGRARLFTPKVDDLTIRLLSATHTVQHIAGVRYEGEYDVSLLSAAGVVQAAETLQKSDLDMAFCFVGAAGHHASRDGFWGFCYFNDAAMAVIRLRELGVKRIMIIDVDPHFGDGTRNILGDDPEVIHINYHSGFVDNENQAYNNYDYGIGGADDAKFMDKINQVLDRDWEFDFLILIFGHDSHRNDYGAFNLSEKSYPFLGRKLHDLAQGKPVLMILSGGSNPSVAELAIPGLIKGFME